MTPREIVAELNKYIVGQDAAKRAVAIAIRKTEIARRLAQLVGAPFLKIEATKYTEVGYVGRDVESMIRDLTDGAIAMVKQEQRRLVETEAKERVTERLVDLLLPNAGSLDPDNPEESE